MLRKYRAKGAASQALARLRLTFDDELFLRSRTGMLPMPRAEALAGQSEDAGLAGEFKELAASLRANEGKIVDELNAVQGQPMDVGGYFQPNDDLAAKAMRPSETFNGIVDDCGTDSRGELVLHGHHRREPSPGSTSRCRRRQSRPHCDARRVREDDSRVHLGSP